MKTSEEINDIITKLDAKLAKQPFVLQKLKDWKLLLLRLTSGDVLLRQDSQARRWYCGEPSELNTL